MDIFSPTYTMCNINIKNVLNVGYLVHVAHVPVNLKFQLQARKLQVFMVARCHYPISSVIILALQFTDNL